MTSTGNDEIKRLAKVFLSAYFPENSTSVDEVWKGIEPQLEMMKRSLPKNELPMFEDALHRIISDAFDST